MSSKTLDILIAIDMPDRRGVVARLCAELSAELARDQEWEREDMVVPWHATAPAFEALPERVVTSILDEWEEADACLAGIEFSGYLETDRGPRAWGCLMVHEGQPRAGRPEVIAITVTESDAGYRLEARLRHPGAGNVDA
jgi:hypothetical protein